MRANERRWKWDCVQCGFFVDRGDNLQTWLTVSSRSVFFRCRSLSQYVIAMDTWIQQYDVSIIGSYGLTLRDS